MKEVEERAKMEAKYQYDLLEQQYQNLKKEKENI